MLHCKCFVSVTYWHESCIIRCAQDADAEGLVATNTAKGGGWMDTILNLIPGRRAAASNEPSEEAIRRTHDNLRWVPKAPFTRIPWCCSP